METPVVWTREQVAEEGEGGRSIGQIFTCLTHIATHYICIIIIILYLPLISVIYTSLLLNGRRLQSMIDPLRRDASPLNVEVIL